MSDDDLRKHAHILLSRYGSSSEFVSISLLTGGRNNRVFKVETENFAALMKVYFRHPVDSRSRCTNEFSFSSFAWKQGIRCIPEPLAYDEELGTALYEFVDGEAIIPGQVTAECIGEAAEFIRRLNRAKHEEDCRKLASASEACFSVEEHVHCIDGRVQKLVHAAETSDFDSRARRFVLQSLRTAWLKVKSEVGATCKKLGIDERLPLTIDERCLSPSDFGFHNALRRPSGKICFLDFEYAGWDDLAKTMCDFFLQPAVPVPRLFFDSFSGAIFSETDNPSLLRERTNLLFPAYRIKWCCIMMNDFLPVGRTRRAFALGAHDGHERRLAQLESATVAIEELLSKTDSGALPPI